MKNISFEYLMISGLSAAAAAFCFYMVRLALNEQQSSEAWLFAASGLLFSVLPALLLIRILASKSEFFARIERTISPKRAEAQGVRFVPHWMMMMGMIVVALVVISVAINVIRSFF
ncbi:MAG: hypothetical protein ACR2L6_07795 [Gemmatimonadaceae bacterium]